MKPEKGDLPVQQLPFIRRGILHNCENKPEIFSSLRTTVKEAADYHHS